MCRGSRLSTKVRVDGVVGEILTISSHEVVWRMLDLVAAADETPGGIVVLSAGVSETAAVSARCLRRQQSRQVARPPKRPAGTPMAHSVSLRHKLKGFSDHDASERFH